MLQHNLPAAMTLRVLFVIGNPTAVDPVHFTTVPFSLTVALNVRVEVMSARVVEPITIVLAIFMRVATKLKSVQCTVAKLLQFTILISVVLVNRIGSFPEMNGSTIQSRRNPWLTVQVKVTVSPGQACLIPTLESRTTVAGYKNAVKLDCLSYIHDDTKNRLKL